MNNDPMPAPRVLIATEHASARFGGEAALPLHYFRVLKGRGNPVWLVTHARTRPELQALFGADPCIRYVEDSWLHKLMYQLGKRLPAQIGYFTTGFVSRFAVQLAQRRIVRQLVRDERIDVVHQPMPVSPREPSMLFGFGVPVVIGPMNGGMHYPPAFQGERGAVERALLGLGRWSAALLNRLMPGKREAALLLVANARTRGALPAGVASRVVELVENGVDLSLWRPAGEAATGPGPADAAAAARAPSHATPTTFVFLGRLVDWKAVDLLVEAFAAARSQAPMRLLVIGDGAERAALEAHAARLGVLATQPGTVGAIEFLGWQAQAACAEQLRAADALVLPSLLECGGAVVLEAMSLAKPVIATAWGGPLDYLDERCGILVAPSGRAALIGGFAEAMSRLAASPDERRALGAHGREKVLRDFDWEVKVDRMLALYASVRPAPAAARDAVTPSRTR